MIELLKKRRSTRKFTGEKIGEDQVMDLKKALLLSPTSRNIDSLDFIFVDSGEMLEELSRSKPHGAAFLKDAALGIIVLGNVDKSDVWVEDASIASIVVQLEAEYLGLGSCWIQIRKRKREDGSDAQDYIREKLSIPKRYHVESIIAVGCKGENREPIKKEDLDFSKIHCGIFNDIC